MRYVTFWGALLLTGCVSAAHSGGMTTISAEEYLRAQKLLMPSAAPTSTPEPRTELPPAYLITPDGTAVLVEQDMAALDPAASPAPFTTPNPLPVQPTPTPEPTPEPTPDLPPLQRIVALRFARELTGNGVRVQVHFVDGNERRVVWPIEGSMTLTYHIRGRANNWSLAQGQATLTGDSPAFVTEGEFDNTHEILRDQPINITYSTQLPDGRTLAGTLEPFLDRAPEM